MAIDLTNVSSGYNLSTINANFNTIETYINSTLLHRNGNVAGETLMTRDLDMNGFSILNSDIDVTSITNDRAIRVPVSEPSLDPLPLAADRKGKILSFDINTGLPVVLAPASGSAVDVFNRLASTAIGDGDALVTVVQPYTGASVRTQHDKNKDTLSIRDFGAIGDGSVHPLSERFASLAAAQAVYPFVTALTQTQDYAAIQAALNAAKVNPGGGCVYIPAATSVAGGYVTKDPIIIPTFVSVYGDGIGSVIKADASLVGDVVKIDTGPTRGPMYLKDFGVVGNGTCNGFGTTITDSITEFKYVYGYTLIGLHVSNCDIGYLFQGLWHSLFTNCTSGSCRVGVQFRGQNVSVLTSGCHFRRDSAALANSIGIDILPYHYAFQGAGVLAQSEALIVDGETMCIGQYIGIWVHGGLDFHFSNLDLDYIGFTGIRVDDINALFTVSDSWIAADVSGTGQFIGINFQSQVVGQPKVVRGVNVTNRTPLGGESNIGIQAIGSAYLNVTDCNLSGTYSLYLKNWNTATVTGNNLGSPFWFENNQNCVVEGNSINSVVYSNTVGYLNNYWGFNPGVQTFGLAQITMAPNATVSSLSLSGLINGAKYGIVQEHVDATDKADTVEIAGNTITVRRAAPSSAFQIDAYVRYRLIK